ncbi:MAG: TIGR04002 family protein [Oscillospiraceae bacterium]|nr:TIGR04002 family protein [Oscillospiraceae bacterium]
MSKNKHMKIVMTGLFAAMICITTAFIFHIPIGNGYVHVGDSLIYLAACVLPFPYGIAAAAIGAAMADAMTGYVIYVIPTFIIKSLNAACFYAIGRQQKLFSVKTIIASALSCFVTIVGYWLAAAILYGNPTAQFINTIIPNLIQGLGSAAIFLALGYAMDKSSISKKFLHV